MTKLAVFVELSKNAKVGPAAATYAPTNASCPKSCPLAGRGCYAEGGHVGLVTRRLNEAAVGATPLQVAKAEAAAIDSGRAFGQALRLHVSGDCRTEPAARAVSAAAVRFRMRGGGQVWTYTHAWRRVPRVAWAGVSVLASCDRPSQGLAALARGYAPAVTVSHHTSERATVSHGVEWIPCPNQTRGVTCTECRLCWNADVRERAGQGIAFAAHGEKGRALAKRLPVLA